MFSLAFMMINCFTWPKRYDEQLDRAVSKMYEKYPGLKESVKDYNNRMEILAACGYKQLDCLQCFMKKLKHKKKSQKEAT